MVKIAKLWGDADFNLRPPLHKLFYIYLFTQPSITTLGVVKTTKNKVSTDLGHSLTDDEWEELIKLKDEGYFFHLIDGIFDIFIVKNHYLSLARNKLNIRKAIDEGKNSKYQEQLREIYSAEDFETGGFKAPSPEEVTEFSLKNGYVVNGREFVNYYAANDWYDKNNKKVRSWKGKLRRVWWREENKLVAVQGAPEGYEYFYVEQEDGSKIFPETWKNGSPNHSNFIYAELLREKFNQEK